MSYKIESFMSQGTDGWLVTIIVSKDARWVELWTDAALERYLNELARGNKLETDELHAMPGYV